MKLNRALISGFRSIEQMNISFGGYGHKVLVGKNESGKSNILKALNLLSTGKLQNKDKKEMGDRVSVLFEFVLYPEEVEDFREKFYERFLEDQEIKITDKLTIKEFFEKFATRILYSVEESKIGYWTNWALPKDVKINGNWYILTDDIVSEYPDLKPQSYVSGHFVNENIKKEHQQKTYLRPVTLGAIRANLHSIVKSTIIPDGYTFPVVNWQYNAAEHNLPIFVVMNSFAADPNGCIPLKNMFLLAGVEEEDIGNTILEKAKLGHNSFANLLSRVSVATNEYIKKTWDEYREITISLRANGENIDIAINDSENSFDFEQRSDGFKRFISFLLLMSTERSEYIDTQLIIIDEPEVGLHPSSARDLRNKLIELGKENLVVYATHSISMIDTENIENNLIVTKENENTKIEVAREDGTSPAENVYRSIGYSIYENMKQKNLLVEGYTDKQIISLFMDKRKWKGFGVCYTDGTKNIQHVSSILQLADRRFFVLSDADKSAIGKKKNMGNPHYWYTYKDLGSDKITIEDFYKQTFFEDTVRGILKEYEIDLPEEIPEVNRMKYIKDFLNRKKNSNDLDDSPISKVMSDIKTKCVNRVHKKNVIADEVKKVLTVLLEKINATTGS